MIVIVIWAANDRDLGFSTRSRNPLYGDFSNEFTMLYYRNEERGGQGKLIAHRASQRLVLFVTIGKKGVDNDNN